METTSILTYIGYAGLILFVLLAVAAVIVFFRFDIRAVRADLSGKAKQRALAEQGSASTVRRKARPNAGAGEPVWSGEVNQGAAIPSDNATRVGAGSDSATQVSGGSDSATQVSGGSDSATQVAGAKDAANAGTVSGGGRAGAVDVDGGDTYAASAGGYGDDVNAYAASKGEADSTPSVQHAVDERISDDQALEDFMNTWSDGAVSDETVRAERDVAAEVAADEPDAGDATVTAIRDGADAAADSGSDTVYAVAGEPEDAEEDAEQTADDFKLTVSRVVVGSGDIIDPDAEESAGA